MTIRMMTRGYLPAALLAVLLASACSESTAGAAAAVDAMSVRRGDLTRTFVLSGELRSENAQVISVPPLPEWNTTIQWLAEDGTLVRTGDRVVELDNTSFASTLDSRRLAVTQALNEITRFDATSQAQLDERVFEFERRKIDLQKARVAATVPKEIISQREWDAAQLALERAETEYRKAEELLKAARTGRAAERRNHELNLEDAQRQLATSERAIDALTLAAPADGIFILREHPWEGRRFQIGDRVFVGLPLAEIPDPAALIVEATLYDVDDGRIAPGQPVELVMDAYPAKSVTGKIASVAPVAQEMDRQGLRRAFRTIIHLDEIDQSMMRPGYSVRVTVPTRVASGALIAPRSAVTHDEDGALLAMADGEMRRVTLGECNAQECTITKGVREGDRVRRAEVRYASN